MLRIWFCPYLSSKFFFYCMAIGEIEFISHFYGRVLVKSNKNQNMMEQNQISDEGFCPLKNCQSDRYMIEAWLFKPHSYDILIWMLQCAWVLIKIYILYIPIHFEAHTSLSFPKQKTKF